MAKDIVAFILAGGKGTRLEALTKKIAKPAVGFAAKYRIIDFPLSNCANSGIDTVCVLTQYESVGLSSYIGNGEKWGLNGCRSITSVLNPRQKEEGANWYLGTADAFYQNLDYLDELNPQHVLILSGDHIYRCTYNEMFRLHKKTGADCTISVIEVDMKEASRFGIMSVDKNNNITEFNEKPKEPKSNLASMGIYIFKYQSLKKALLRDAKNENSSHDFGKDIIPMMLNEKEKLVAYHFSGYWRDVGTIASLHEANMDLLNPTSQSDFFGKDGRMIYTEDTHSLPAYIGKRAKVQNCIVNQGSIILGNVSNSIISDDVLIEEGTKIDEVVAMRGARVKAGATVSDAILAPNSIVKEDESVNETKEKVVLYAKGEEK